MTAINEAILGSNHYAVDLRSSTNTVDNKAYVATFNTPVDSFDTIVIPKVIGGNTGDVIKVSIYKGSIPNDPSDGGADDSDAPAILDINDFEEEVIYNVTAAIPPEGDSIEFAFNKTFTQAILGDTYSVLVEQFDSSGSYVPFSIVFCTARDGVDNYINGTDNGHQSGTNNFTQGGSSNDGGAGNCYTLNGATLNALVDFGYTKYTINLITSTWTVNGTSQKDPCPAWGIYSRAVVTNPATGTNLTADEQAYLDSWLAGTALAGRDYGTLRLDSDGELLGNYINWDHEVDNDEFEETWSTYTKPAGRDFGTKRINDDGLISGNYIHTDYPEND